VRQQQQQQQQQKQQKREMMIFRLNFDQEMNYWFWSRGEKR